MRISIRRSTLWTLIAVAGALLALASGCGSDSSSGPGSNNTTPKAVSGTAAKGGIDGASINLYQIEAGGSMGSLVAGPFTTDASGAWSGEVPASTTGTLLVVASGGSYVDEATDAVVSVSSDLYGFLEVGVGTGNATPITHAVVVNAQARVANGASIATAIDDAITGMTTSLGYDPTAADFPAALRSGAAGERAEDSSYIVLLAGISQLLSTPPTGFESADVWDMVIGLAQDMSDGVLDGLDAFGDPIFVNPGNGSPIQWPALDGDDLGALIDAANQWAGDAQLPAIDNPDFTDFGDIGDVGEGTPTGSVTISGDLNTTFNPTGGIPTEGALIWWDNSESSLGVNSVLGTVTVVTFASSQGGGWQALAPQSGVTLAGNSATFNGLQLNGIINPQSTIVLSGTIAFE